MRASDLPAALGKVLVLRGDGGSLRDVNHFPKQRPAVQDDLLEGVDGGERQLVLGF